MNTGKWTKARIIFLGGMFGWLGTTSLSGAGAATNELDLPEVSLVDEGTVAEVPTPPVGATRDFVGPVAGVNCSHWEVVASPDKDTLLSACGEYKIHLKRSENLNMQKLTAAGDKTVMEFEPAYPVVAFPLEVGKHWHRQYTGHAAVADATWSGDMTCDVADFGEIKVAAGAFKAFRIECIDAWKMGPATTHYTLTTWYAPSIKSVVKSLNYEDPHMSTELKAYVN